jgi:hypothetical protein
MHSAVCSYVYGANKAYKFLRILRSTDIFWLCWELTLYINLLEVTFTINSILFFLQYNVVIVFCD